MKVRYWGTAAAEGIPCAFCGCKVCAEARKKGGRYIRTRSQALVDDSLLIDFNADTYTHSLHYRFDLSKMQSVLDEFDELEIYFPKVEMFKKHYYGGKKNDWFLKEIEERNLKNEYDRLQELTVLVAD